MRAKPRWQRRPSGRCSWRRSHGDRPPALRLDASGECRPARTASSALRNAGRASTAGDAAARLQGLVAGRFPTRCPSVPYGAPKVSIAKLKRPCSQVIESLPLSKTTVIIVPDMIRACPSAGCVSCVETNCRLRAARRFAVSPKGCGPLQGRGGGSAKCGNCGNPDDERCRTRDLQAPCVASPTSAAIFHRRPQPGTRLVPAFQGISLRTDSGKSRRRPPGFRWWTPPSSP